MKNLLFAAACCLAAPLGAPDTPSLTSVYPDQPAADYTPTAAAPLAGFVLVKGGTFQMGSEEGDSDEKPLHTVTVSDFYLAKYEVTVGEFKKFVKATGYRTDAEKEGTSYAMVDCSWETTRNVNWRHDDLGHLRPDSLHHYPVGHVSWNDAVAYCKWLSRKNGRTYRLPTEAEWEYAAGNGAPHTRYSWGNDLPTTPAVGNVADTSWYNTCGGSGTFAPYGDGYLYAAPVGSFAPNALGIYDLEGNVCEWCSDWKGAYSADNQTNPTGPKTGTDRVQRGGAWLYGPRWARVANRNSLVPTGRFSVHGFRLATGAR